MSEDFCINTNGCARRCF